MNHNIKTKRITVSAPGKIMLMGEHAVLHNEPCIVTAVDQRMIMEIEQIEKKEIIINAPQVNLKEYKKDLILVGKGNIPKEAKFIELAVNIFSQKFKLVEGLKIKTRSDFSANYGIGSSSAVTVCLLKGLSDMYKIKLTNKDLFNLAYQVVLAAQGKGSGFDLASAIWGGTIYFLSGGKIIEPLKIEKLPLIIGYSGNKADTVNMINKVNDQSLINPKPIAMIYEQIGLLVRLAKQAIKKQQWEILGGLMNINQGLLSSLCVSTLQLEKIIYSAREAGAIGVKLSGAGGGDCIIALALRNNKFIKRAITKVGGLVIECQTNAEGVKLEL